MARATNAQFPPRVAHGWGDVGCGVMAVLVDPGESVTPIQGIDVSLRSSLWSSLSVGRTQMLRVGSDTSCTLKGRINL
jgi:hypothetical protein